MAHLTARKLILVYFLLGAYVHDKGPSSHRSSQLTPAITELMARTDATGYHGMPMNTHLTDLHYCKCMKAILYVTPNNNHYVCYHVLSNGLS